MKRFLLATVLVLAACSGGSGETESTVPTGIAPTAQIALITAEGNVALHDPATGTTTAVTEDAGSRQVYSQPTWSPDGTHLAFVASAVPVSGIQASDRPVRVRFQAQSTVTGAIHLTTGAGEEPTIIATPFPAFYLYWSPDGKHLAFLGNDPSLPGQAFGLVDIPAGSASRVDTGQPYFFAWSPESDRLLVHAANRELYYLTLDGAREPLAPTPGVFSAPDWIGDTLLFPVLEGRRQVLRLFEPDGTSRRDATRIGTAVSLGLNPDEERVAFIEAGDTANPFGLGPLAVTNPDNTVDIAERAAAFFWSPDGSQLMYLTPDISDNDFGLRWNVWDGNRSIAFERFLPTTTFFQQYLPFFGQYDRSLTFFSPDGSSFTFAGTIEGRGDGIWTQAITPDTPAELVGPGEFSTWAP